MTEQYYNSEKGATPSQTVRDASQNLVSKKCTHCCSVKPLTDFILCSTTTTGRGSICTECYREKERARTKLRRQAGKMKGRTREQERNRYWKQRNEVFQFYGQCCVWCGESDVSKLQIDHVNDDGQEHRAVVPAASNKIAKIVKRDGFPDKYQILCQTCNVTKGAAVALLKEKPTAVKHLIDHLTKKLASNV